MQKRKPSAKTLHHVGESSWAAPTLDQNESRLGEPRMGNASEKRAPESPFFVSSRSRVGGDASYAMIPIARSGKRYRVRRRGNKREEADDEHEKASRCFWERQAGYRRRNAEAGTDCATSHRSHRASGYFLSTHIHSLMGKGASCERRKEGKSDEGGNARFLEGKSHRSREDASHLISRKGFIAVGGLALFQTRGG